MMQDMPRIHDVIIVGCGPVGALAGNLLGEHGISTLVIEQGRQPYDLPRAIHFDHEVMRILQSCGLAEMVLPQLSQPAGAMHFGADRAVIRQFQKIVRTDRLGWATDYFFYQPDLERTLRSALLNRSNVELVDGHEFVSLEQQEDRVRVLARSDTGEEFRATGRYLLACDGGRSTVRKRLDVHLEDLGFDEPWIVVDVMVDGPVKMPDLRGAPDGVDMQDVMFIIGDPARPVSVIPGVGRHRRWEFMLLPGETADEISAPEMVEALLAPWLGNTSYELTRCAVYRFHALLASRWKVGRTFLVGDAAHQTPPFFGQGLCHGIRDAANLAWKLALVLDGRASSGILDSYEVERLPQVRGVVEASVRTGRYICTLDPDAARRRDAEMRESADRTPPAYVDIIPPLADGILSAKGASPCAVGSRFIQPPMVGITGHRTLLDEMTGGGFVLLATEIVATPEGEQGATLKLSCWRVLERGETPLLETDLADCSGELFKWFDHFGCRGVLVRPDFYVYGVFSTVDEGSMLLEKLRAQLHV